MKKIQVAHYFQKNGFCDGRNEKLLQRASNLRVLVVRLLNEKFRERKLPFIAVALEYGTCHNPVRVELQWHESGIFWSWDYYYGLSCEDETVDVDENFLPKDVEEVFVEVQRLLRRVRQ